MITMTESKARRWAEAYKGTIAHTSKGITIVWLKGQGVMVLCEEMIRTKGGRKYLSGEWAGSYSSLLIEWQNGTLTIEGSDEFKAIAGRWFSRQG